MTDALEIAQALRCEQPRCRCGRRAGQGYLTHCPAHQDEHPSLTVCDRAAGTVLVHCHAGCPQAQVIAALRARGLWPHRPGGSSSQRTIPPRRRITATYDYRDAQGRLLYQVVRYAPKGFALRRPDGKGGWRWNLSGVQPVLYRLPDLLRADPAQPVFVVEGEKDAERLWALGFVATTNPFGAGKWRQEFAEVLRDRDVIIIPDNDAPGRAHAEAVARSLQGLARSIRVLVLPDLPEHGDVSDWLDRGHTREELLATANMASPWSPNGHRDLPLIVTNNRQLRDLSDDALKAIVAANTPPALFVRGGQIVRVLQDEDRKPRIAPVGVYELRGFLSRAATWVAREVSDERLRHVHPPVDVARDLLARGHWPDLPPLSGVTTAPVLTPEGTLLTRPGYDPSTGLVYIPDPDLTDLDIPERPDAAQVRQAVQVLTDDLLVDFPFADEGSRAHALALLLTPFVRPSIDGPVPLFLIDAPGPGAGKGLLADVCAIPFDPRGLPRMTAARDDEEWRKKITTVVMAGRTHVLIDNIAGRLASADLAAVLTAWPDWEDRVLGSNTLVRMPHRTIWVATGNNVSLSDELARRTVWIRLVPPHEQPWLRGAFRHARLRLWARTHRPLLVRAVLTLVQAWISRGRPCWSGRAPGSFEAWADALGGILESCAIAGFLANAPALYEQSDPERATWRAFVQAWWEQYHDKPVGVAELCTLAAHGQWLVDVLGDGSDQARRVRLGIALRKRVDQVYGRYQIRRAGTHGGAQRYRLVALGESGESHESPGTSPCRSMAPGSTDPRAPPPTDRHDRDSQDSPESPVDSRFEEGEIGWETGEVLA